MVSRRGNDVNELSLKIEKLKGRILSTFSYTIDVDEGWYQIIVDCDEELAVIDPGYKILQVKEKFGGLRFYFQASEINDHELIKNMQVVVRKYEVVAGKTCEATGKEGVLMKSIGGRFKTLNPDYAKSALHYARYSLAQ